MILVIEEVEAAALTLYMKLMRKPFRNLIKVNYSAYKDDYLQSYDYVAEEAEKALRGEYTSYEVNMNIRDVVILQEFLRAFLSQAQVEADQVAKKDKAKAEEFELQLSALRSVQQKALETIGA